jgi:hypothetical protein
MSAYEAAKKRDPWEVVENMMAEAEAERVEALSDEELEGELRAVGIDPATIPTVEELLERGKARAAERAKGQGNAALREPLPQNVRALRSATGRARLRQRLWIGAIAAAFLVAFGSIGFIERDAIVAIFTKPPVTPREIKPDDVEEQRRTAARKERDQAEKACAGELWGRCQNELDDAAGLDPAGESEARVQRMRKAIVDHTATHDDKMPRP